MTFTAYPPPPNDAVERQGGPAGADHEVKEQDGHHCVDAEEHDRIAMDVAEVREPNEDRRDAGSQAENKADGGGHEAGLDHVHPKRIEHMQPY